MGYYKQKEIRAQVEEANRVRPPVRASSHVSLAIQNPTRKQLRLQRQTIDRRIVKKFLFETLDMIVIIFASAILGASIVALIWVTS